MTAADFLNTSDRETLADAFRSYGDERHARRLAREVVRRRETRPMTTSDDFVGAIRAVLGPRSGAPDFARLFQAIRIAVNDELSSLERALPALRDRLLPGGAFVVIAYHSGEDRIVKNAFRDWSAACICPPRQPVCTCRGHPLGTTLTRRPLDRVRVRDDLQSARAKRAAARMAKGVGKARSRRGARPGTRSLIALVLVGFVLVATGVIARRVLGVAAEPRFAACVSGEDALEAERIRLEGVIRDASSRARLQPIAEQRLNMHIPTPGPAGLAGASHDSSLATAHATP